MWKGLFLSRLDFLDILSVCRILPMRMITFKKAVTVSCALLWITYIPISALTFVEVVVCICKMICLFSFTVDAFFLYLFNSILHHAVNLRCSKIKKK